MHYIKLNNNLLNSIATTCIYVYTFSLQEMIHYKITQREKREMANYFNHHHPPLPQQVIQHKSHPWHPLILLSTPPYYGGGFTCDACRHGGHDFTYHCPTCHYDLHVGCASLPETVIRGDHQHPLTLFYCGYKEEGNTFICDVCHGNVPDGCWIYYCKSCDYGTHLGCATAEASPVAEEEEGTEEYSMAEAESRLKLLQLQMQLAQQNAESIIDAARMLSRPT